MVAKKEIPATTGNGTQTVKARTCSCANWATFSRFKMHAQTLSPEPQPCLTNSVARDGCERPVLRSGGNCLLQAFTELRVPPEDLTVAQLAKKSPPFMAAVGSLPCTELCTGPYTNYMTPVHRPPPHYFKTRFNIILSCSDTHVLASAKSAGARLTANRDLFAPQPINILPLQKTCVAVKEPLNKRSHSKVTNLSLAPESRVGCSPTPCHLQSVV
jgi:hypothetical protein